MGLDKDGNLVLCKLMASEWVSHLVLMRLWVEELDC